MATIPTNDSQLPTVLTCFVLNSTNHEASDINTIGTIVIAVPTIDNNPKNISKNFNI